MRLHFINGAWRCEREELKNNGHMIVSEWIPHAKEPERNYVIDDNLKESQFWWLSPEIDNVYGLFF